MNGDFYHDERFGGGAVDLAHGADEMADALDDDDLALGNLVEDVRAAEVTCASHRRAGPETGMRDAGLALITLGLSIGVVALVVLHLTPSGLSPLRNPVSQYGRWRQVLGVKAQRA